VRCTSLETGAAELTGQTKVFQPLQSATTTGPIPDFILDELQFAGLPEIGEWKDCRQDGLQSVITTLLVEEIHLQEIHIGAPLNLNQVRQGNRRFIF
jgi:hypothetical protein